MKNRKGFTLVELLAVIVILSIVLIIATPNILKALNASKETLNDIDKKNLQDAAKQVGIEVLNCDLTSGTYDVLGKSNTLGCAGLQKEVVDKEVTTTVKKLVDNDYFVDTSNRCNGNIKITISSNNYNITVDVSDVTCVK